jgi:hypothetical protein
MDFIDEIQALKTRLAPRKDHVQTEEATKTSLIMPFINVLGYNVFDPTEVVPEFTADIGTKQGEKVDYAIIQDGKPVILFECKQKDTNLNDERHWNQLARYFMVTETRFAVLTDGLGYRFYSDLDTTKRMDEKPFLEFDILEINESQVEELKRFTKSSFQLEELLDAARELKYTKEIKRILGEQLSKPADDFVRFFQSQVYSGRNTSAIRQQFQELTKQALGQFINERINDRLEKASALGSEYIAQQTTQASEPSSSEQVSSVEEDDDGIVTTAEEFQGYYIVKAILHDVIDIKRVAMRDQRGFCSVLLDNNNRKPICRLRFNSQQKYLGLIDQQKQEQRVTIEDVDEIYSYIDQIRATVGFYDNQGAEATPETEA